MGDAGAAPQGQQGKDWNRQSVTIQNGATADITATCITQNTKPGNTSSVVLYIDGARIDGAGGPQATSQLQYRLTGDGAHDIMIMCANTNADAFACNISVKTEKPFIVG
jgi:hypothetical protein